MNVMKMNVMKMNVMRRVFLALVCCAFVGGCLVGCSNQEVKQDPGQGGKGLSTDEKKAKKGDE